MPERRLYIINLERGVQQKRFFLEGDDTDQARAQLKAVVEKMPTVAATSRDWLDFLKEATREFARAGFLHVAH